MKNFLFFTSAACGALAAFLIWQSDKSESPVPELAHQLEDAWRDHHTQS